MQEQSAKNVPSGKPQKRKIEQLQFIRAVCALGIVLYHICSYTNCQAIKGSFYRYKNGSPGTVIVEIFFIISGFVLSLNYSGSFSLRKYYYKRWRSIFPVFYIAFLFYYSESVFTKAKVFYNGNPLRLLWTVFGMDGYMNYLFKTYYQVGQWFLGALIILYLLFPLVIILIKGKRCIPYFIVLLTAFSLLLYFKPFKMSNARNIITCLVPFSAGILFARHLAFIENDYTFAVSVVLSILLLTIKLPIINNISNLLFGCFSFIILYRLGTYILKVPVLSRAVTFIASISFPIFLVQQRTILRVYGVSNPSTLPEGLLVLFVIFCLTIIFAWVLNCVNKALLSTRIFKKLDGFLLKS